MAPTTRRYHEANSVDHRMRIGRSFAEKKEKFRVDRNNKCAHYNWGTKR